MNKIIRINEKDFNLEGYESHYNKLPEDFEIISEESFFNKFMNYVWEYSDHKQIFQPRLDLKLFITRAWDITIGVAFVRESGSTNIKYGQFGDWKTYAGKFADQFQGDNS